MPAINKQIPGALTALAKLGKKGLLSKLLAISHLTYLKISNQSTCLGFLGQSNTNRIISITVLPPKVAKVCMLTY
jgi:hypothetical protein